MKKFTWLMAAALFCGMSAFAQDDEPVVTPAIDDNMDVTFSFNNDYNYYVIYLDDETRKANISDDRYVYIGPDDNEDRHLYIWATSSTFAEPSGNNSFDQPGNYMSYVVGSDGWSGLGYLLGAANTYDLSGINDDYKFHLAVMADDDDVVDFNLQNSAGREAHIVLGNEASGDNEPVANFERDGEWYNIDIPMTYLEDNFGLSYKKETAFTDHYILTLSAGSRKGFTINYDAVFFYGPKNSSSGVKEIESAESKNAPLNVYTADGKLVSKQYAKSHKGMYVVKQGDKTKKVIF